MTAVISTLFGNSGLVSCTADSTADDDVENAKSDNLSDLALNAGTVSFFWNWGAAFSEFASDLDTVIGAVPVLFESEVDGATVKVKPILLLVVTDPSTKDSDSLLPNNESSDFGSGTTGFSTAIASLGGTPSGITTDFFNNSALPAPSPNGVDATPFKCTSSSSSR